MATYSLLFNFADTAGELIAAIVLVEAASLPEIISIKIFYNIIHIYNVLRGIKTKITRCQLSSTPPEVWCGTESVCIFVIIKSYL